MSVLPQYREQLARLDLAALMTDARKATGLSNFNVDDWGPFTRYLDGVARGVNFKPGGIDTFRNAMLRHLVNRLRIEEDLRRHPEILDEDVSDPIVIIGMPRTGTTKLQRMLSAAPEVQKLYLWRMLNPAPFPDAVPGAPDPRIRAAQLGDGVGSETMESNSEVMAGHEMTPMEVDEDVFLFDFTLDQSIVGVGAYAAYFNDDEWAAGTSDRESDLRGYRYVRTLLQYLQWQDGGRGVKNGGRPWILKLVPHLAHLDSLLACYPKATIVYTHRNPHTVVASIAKVMYNLYSLSAEVDKHFVGEAMLHWCYTMTDRAMEARDRLQLNDRIFDVRYEDIRGNTMPLIREIYRRAGRVLTPAAEAAMADWEKRNEQGKHGKHVYALEEFGLDDASVSRRFAEYTKRFSAMF